MIVFFSQVQTHHFSFFCKDDVFLKGAIEAAAWCRLQSFNDSFSLPIIIGMKGEELEAALTELRADDCRDPEESQNKIEPLCFFFKSRIDYEMFCVEMLDKRNL